MKQAGQDGGGQNVFIVDDDAAIREGLVDLLEAVGLAAEAFASAEQFWSSWKGSKGGCLLLDARLPGMSGPELQEKMRAAGVGLPIIFMTAHGDIPLVRKVMKAGAVEFLVKPFRKEELLHAVESAFALDRQRRAAKEEQNSIRARIASLSPREREVLRMVATGQLNKQIAAHLNISEVMVKTHRRNMMEKMQADSLAALVTLCERAQGGGGTR